MTSRRTKPATAPRAPAPARRRITKIGAPPKLNMHATTIEAVAARPNANGHATDDHRTPAPPATAGEVIALDEVQRRLRISDRALARMTREPGFPPIARLSAKHRLVSLAAINLWLAGRWRTPPAATRSASGAPDVRGRRQTRVARLNDAARMADFLAEKVAKARGRGVQHDTLPAMPTGGRGPRPHVVEYVHVGELALQLRASTEHVQRLLRRPGAPPVLWIGPRARLVRAVDVEYWLARTCEQVQHALPVAAGGRL